MKQSERKSFYNSIRLQTDYFEERDQIPGDKTLEYPDKLKEFSEKIDKSVAFLTSHLIRDNREELDRFIEATDNYLNELCDMVFLLREIENDAVRNNNSSYIMGLFALRKILMVNGKNLDSIVNYFLQKEEERDGRDNQVNKEEKEQQLREKLKAEIMEEMKNSQTISHTKTHVLSDIERKLFYQRLSLPARVYFENTQTIRNSEDDYTVIFDIKERYDKYTNNSNGCMDDVIQILSIGRDNPIHISLAYDEKVHISSTSYIPISGIEAYMMSDDEKEQPW